MIELVNHVRKWCAKFLTVGAHETLIVCVDYWGMTAYIREYDEKGVCYNLTLVVRAQNMREFEGSAVLCQRLKA